RLELAALAPRQVADDRRLAGSQAHAGRGELLDPGDDRPFAARVVERATDPPQDPDPVAGRRYDIAGHVLDLHVAPAGPQADRAVASGDAEVADLQLDVDADVARQRQPGAQHHCGVARRDQLGRQIGERVLVDPGL